jgi:hypothetical protein
VDLGAEVVHAFYGVGMIHRIQVLGWHGRFTQPDAFLLWIRRRLEIFERPLPSFVLATLYT